MSSAEKKRAPASTSVTVGRNGRKIPSGSVPAAVTPPELPWPGDAITDPLKIPGMFWHSPERCNDALDLIDGPRPCVLHNPTAHHMRGWPVYLRASTLIERVCVHGIGHPDPDSLDYFLGIGKTYMAVHGCDGCCADRNGDLNG